MTPRWPAIAAVLAALGSLSPTRSAAQTIRGVVVDSADAPVPGVVVLLLDAASSPTARALTNERGEYRVSTPRPGTYHLHTLRIGFRPLTSEPMVLSSSQDVTRRIVLAGVPFPLATVRVEGKSSCGAIGNAAATFAVWEQARTALTATQLTASARVVRATTVTYDRTMDAGFRRVLDQTAAAHTELVTQPWRSPPPQTVRQAGYVTEDREGATTYSAPGLDVLLSSTFLEDHCFRLINASDKRRIGIAFEPTPAREKREEIAEIRGTLWLDRATSELRSIDFRYVNVSAEQEATAGGAMEFVRMRNGAWAVSRWNVRMPELEQKIRSQTFGGNAVSVASIKVTGGELVLAMRESDTLWARAPLTLAGVVRDSTSGDPLPNARVTFGGAPGSSGPHGTSDGRGQFEIPGVLPGQYTLDVRTPSLDSVGAVHRAPVTFIDPDTRIQLRVPTGAQITAVLCGTGRLDAPGIVVGTVTLRGDSVLPSNINVVAEWTDDSAAATSGGARAAVPNAATSRQARWVKARLDAGGTFRVCGVPLNTALDLRAEADGAGAMPVTVRITSGRSARADLVLDRSMTRSGVFAGVVLADSGRGPIAGAEIALPDVAKAVVTNDAGEFRVSGVPPGRQRVTARRLGFAPLDTVITVAPNQTVDRRIYLRRVVTLDSVSVVAERVVIPSFEEHRKLGFGHFLTREQLAKQEGRRFSEILREIPTVNVIPGVGNRGWLTSSRQAVAGRAGSVMNLDKADSLAGAVPGRCYARVYMDNTLIYRGRDGEPLFDLNSIAPSQIEAVEYYASPVQTPARYAGPSSVCGVLVIWTRRG